MSETPTDRNDVPEEPLGRRARRPRSTSQPLELLRYRSNLLGADLRITNFGGGNTSSKFDLPDPLTGEPHAGDGGEGQRRRSALDRHVRLRHALSRQARSADRALPRRGARGRDGRLLSAVRVRREPRRRVDRHAAARVPAVRRTSITCIPTGRSRWPRAPTARRSWRSSTSKYGRNIVWVPWQRPGFELALMLRARGRGQPRLRRHHPRRPRPVHLGRHAARVLPQQHPDHRSDGRVRRRSTRRAPAGRCSAARRSTATVADREAIVGGAPAVPARRRLVEPPRHRALRRQSDDALAFANSTWAEELCRMGTSCPDHFLRTRISPMFIPWDPGDEDARRRSRSGSPSGIVTVPRGLRRVLPGVRRAGLAGAARHQPVGGRHSRPRAVRLRQGQARGAHHHRVLRQRHPRDGRRQRARGRRRAEPAPAAAGAARRSRRRSSRASTTTSRCRGSRRSASSTGRSKRPSCSGCRPSASSAARSSSWSAARSGIGREVALQIAKRGGHVVVADLNAAGAEEAAQRGGEAVVGGDGAGRRRSTSTSRDDASPRRSAPTVLQFGGVDIVDQHRGDLSDARRPARRRRDVWAQTLQHQRHAQLRAGAGGGEGPEGAEACRRRSC